MNDLGLFDDAQRDDVDRRNFRRTLRRNRRRPPTLGTPIALPYDADPSTAPRATYRWCERGIVDAEAQGRRPPRPRTHAQHVAHDPADAGCGAFERHDLGRMVVGFVRSRRRSARQCSPRCKMQESSAGPRTTKVPLVGNLCELRAARLVAAMLAPLRIERVQLHVGGSRPSRREMLSSSSRSSARFGEARRTANQGRLPAPSVVVVAVSPRRQRCARVRQHRRA